MNRRYQRLHYKPRDWLLS